MPPPGMPPGIADLLLPGASTTSASVVRMFFAIEAAFCSAERVTIVGSMIPALTRSSTSPVSTLRPWPLGAVRTVFDDDRALEAGVVGELAERLLERAQDDRRTRLRSSSPSSSSLIDGLAGVQERDAAARHDALLEGRAGGLQRVLDAVLLLLHLGLGGSADLDHRDAAGELRQPLLQLLAVEVGVGVLDLLT